MLTIVAAVAIVVALSGCTPQQIAAYKAMAPEDQAKVVAALQDQQDQERRFYEGIVASRALSTDCYAAMRAVWPAHLHGWASGIISRESGGFHAADNSSSSASGCWQLLSSLHADKYAAAGCHVSQWADALCNNRAAYVLYQQAGSSPWRL